MTTSARANRRISIPTVASGPLPRGPIDIRTEGFATIVTLDLPGFLLADLQWEVSNDVLVVRSIDPLRGLHLPIALQGRLFPARFVVFVNGTIFDIRMQRHES